MSFSRHPLVLRTLVVRSIRFSLRVSRLRTTIRLTRTLSIYLSSSSHGNSKKVHTNQPSVAKSVADQIAAGEHAIRGVMLESNLREGKQALKPGVTHPSQLKYGVSVTDACIDMESTAGILRELAKGVRARRAKAKAATS